MELPLHLYQPFTFALPECFLQPIYRPIQPTQQAYTCRSRLNSFTRVRLYSVQLLGVIYFLLVFLLFMFSFRKQAYMEINVRPRPICFILSPISPIVRHSDVQYNTTIKTRTAFFLILCQISHTQFPSLVIGLCSNFDYLL